MGFWIPPLEEIATPTLEVEKFTGLAKLNCSGPAGRTSVSPARGFEEEPGPTLGFIDPYFDETCRRDVAMFVAHVVRFAQTRGECFVVVHQLGQHIQRLDVFGIVIEHALGTRDLSDRMQRESTDLAHTFCDNVGHGEELLGVVVEEQVIIAEMMPAHVPMEIFGFQIEREHVRKDRVHRSRDIPRGFMREVRPSFQWRVASVQKLCFSRIDLAILRPSFERVVFIAQDSKHHWSAT